VSFIFVFLERVLVRTWERLGVGLGLGLNFNPDDDDVGLWEG